MEVISGTDGNLTQGKIGLRGRRADDFFDNFAVWLYPSYPSAVGGKAGPIVIPVNKLGLLAPYIGLTILLAVAVATVV